jgi:nucleotide-binding universal stress UspA family protein
MFKKILVANDGSPSATKAANAAIELAAKLGARLTIAHVLLRDATPQELGRALEEHGGSGIREKLAEAGYDAAPLPVGAIRPSLPEGMLRAVGEHILEVTEEQARAGGVPDVRCVLRAGRPSQELMDLAQEENVDLIVMGTRGLGTFSGLLHGSVSQRVSQLAHRSCLIVV